MIPIGWTSKVGWGTSGVFALPTVVKVLEGAQHLGTSEKATLLTALISFALTQIGRYAQAHKTAK